MQLNVIKMTCQFKVRFICKSSLLKKGSFFIIGKVNYAMLHSNVSIIIIVITIIFMI